MAPFAPYLDWIDTQYDRVRCLLTQWARINTGTGNLPGLAKFLSILKQEFDSLGGDVQEIALEPPEEIDSRGQCIRRPLGNLLSIVKRPTSPLRVLLAIHTDTVYPANHPFQEVWEEGGNLRGPGVADAKGGIAVMLLALQALERCPLASKIGWQVILNPDEEIGSPGSTAVFRTAAATHHVGLVFEPSLPDGALVGARGGSGNFTVVVRGKPAHVGREFEKGRSAIYALADAIFALREMVQPGHVVVNVGQIEGGGPVNVVPELAIARVNVRVGDASDQAAAEIRLRHIVADIEKAEGIRAALHGGFLSPPKPLQGRTLALFEHVAACGRDLGLSLSWRPSGGVCDGNKLAAAGLPTIDTLGPRGGGIHSDGEYLVLQSLTERAKLTALLLLKLAAGEIPWAMRTGP